MIEKEKENEEFPPKDDIAIGIPGMPITEPNPYFPKEEPEEI